MKGDIAANIRQGNLTCRNRQSFGRNQDLAEQIDVNKDENEDDGEDGENEHDSGNGGDGEDGEDGENDTNLNVDAFPSNLRETSHLVDDLDDQDDDEEESF